MRKLLVCAFLLTFLAEARPLDPVTSVPDQALTSAAALGRFLAQDTTDPQEKAHRIYRWIAANINYDVPALRSGRQDSSAESVLRRRQGVCAGYSQLYKTMGEAAGLEVTIIPGRARGSSGPLSPHAWNAVKLHGEWKLLDATWGAGYVDSEGAYNRANTEFYFMTDPQKFVTEHLPEDSKWQLLPQPVAEAEYLSMSAQRPSRDRGTPVALAEPATTVSARPAVSLASPRQLYSYGYRGARLIRPVAGTLTLGSQIFHLAVPGAEAVMVATEEQSFTLLAVPGRYGEFRASVPMSAGKVRVLAKFGPNARYEPLLEYEAGGGAR